MLSTLITGSGGTVEGSRELIRRSGESVVVDKNAHGEYMTIGVKEADPEYYGNFLGPNPDVRSHYL